MDISAIKGSVPWWAKVAAKLVLSRLPFSYGFWRRAGLFVHGGMDRPAYAYDVFRAHFDRCRAVLDEAEFVCLEVGPGDTLFSALIARAHGAGRTLLVDAGRFARDDLAPYRAMSDYLVARGHRAVDVADCRNLSALLARCGAEYLTEGLASLQKIPSASVDWIWSQAVLEHIQAREFASFILELRRILKPGGIASHRVDLKDHLGGSLNNLRFADGVWESSLFAGAGFYTNRIRYTEMCRMFESAGFEVDVVGVDRWAELPLKRDSMNARFRTLPSDELCVQGFDVLLRMK